MPCICINTLKIWMNTIVNRYHIIMQVLKEVSTWRYYDRGTIHNKEFHELGQKLLITYRIQAIPILNVKCLKHFTIIAYQWHYCIEAPLLTLTIGLVKGPVKSPQNNGSGKSILKNDIHATRRLNHVFYYQGIQLYVCCLQKY